MKLNLIEKLMLRSPLWLNNKLRKEAGKVLAHIPSLENGACLELGCGYGAGALLIKHYTGCESLISIDIDHDMITKAKQYISKPSDWAVHIPRDGIEFLEADACNLPFDDQSFHGVFHFFMLDHIQSWQETIREVFRVLKPGGIYSFADALIPDTPLALNGFFGHIPIKENDLTEALQDTGFAVESFETAGGLFKRCYVIARKPENEGAEDDNTPQKHITP